MTLTQWKNPNVSLGNRKENQRCIGAAKHPAGGSESQVGTIPPVEELSSNMRAWA